MPSGPPQSRKDPSTPRSPPQCGSKNVGLALSRPSLGVVWAAVKELKPKLSYHDPETIYDSLYLDNMVTQYSLH